MFGFINVYKEENMTSHDVVSSLRKISGIKKIGHGGTLDPLATGVLVIGIGDATRLFEYINDTKEYIAEVLFGIATDTDDVTGKVISESNVIPNLLDIQKISTSFIGDIVQKPPIYSALKSKGKKLYELARKDLITLEDVHERKATVFLFEILDFNNDRLKVKIACSKGTYIRSIARDLGVKLNTCATLSKLERTKHGDFSVIDSIKLGDLNRDFLSRILKNPNDYINLSSIKLEDELLNKVLHGNKIKSVNVYPSNSLIKLLDLNDKLIGIGEVKEGFICPVKIFK